MVNCGYHGNNASVDQNIDISFIPADKLHTKIKVSVLGGGGGGGKKHFYFQLRFIFSENIALVIELEALVLI